MATTDEQTDKDEKSSGAAGAFGALLQAAAKEPGAARGLALAYAALPPGHRKQLIDAVLVDAQAEGVCPTLVLASLLSVEVHAGVAQHIADAMAAVDTHEVRTAAHVQTHVAGDSERGGLLVIRPLHGTFVEAWALAWQPGAGVVKSLFEPLTHHKDASNLLARLPAELEFEEMPLAFAVDVVAPPLWHHRRLHGQLPLEAARFADLFSCVAAGTEPIRKDELR